MKFLLLKTLLIRRGRDDEGFVVPVVISLGLIMVLLGTFSIVKSSDENLNAITQRSTSIALAAAETGIAQYQQLLSRNRAIAVYSDSDWIDSNLNNLNLCNTNTEITNAINSNNFKNVVTSTSTYDDLGQYKLVSYQYLNGATGATVVPGTNPNNDTIGRLIVEGRANSNDTGGTRIQVDIPIRREAPKLTDLDPALWIDSTSVTNIGGDNLIVGKDNNNNRDLTDVGDGYNSIIFSNPATVSSGCNVPTGLNQPNNGINVNSEKVFSIPYSFPNTPAEPSKYIKTNSNNLNELMAAGGKLPSALGQDIDNAKDTNNIYHYVIDGNLTLTSDLRVNSGTRIMLYVCGDITIDNSAGTININKNALTNTSSNLEIYGNNTAISYSFCDAADKTRIISFTGGGITNIEALIHAPDATIRIASDETIRVIGAIWVDDWNDSSSGSTVTVTSDTDSHQEYLSRASFVMPTLSNATEWKTIVIP
ncbi:MAG: hypothetical protein QNJ60_00800 [Xenococcaceae cyanobacterium MO_188.B19]|nr:hypothetical protein [Xenococcaceae cyanobacterium MO_188.B19]